MESGSSAVTEVALQLVAKVGLGTQTAVRFGVGWQWEWKQRWW